MAIGGDLVQRGGGSCSCRRRGPSGFIIRGACRHAEDRNRGVYVLDESSLGRRAFAGAYEGVLAAGEGEVVKLRIWAG